MKSRSPARRAGEYAPAGFGACGLEIACFTRPSSPCPTAGIACRRECAGCRLRPSRGPLEGWARSGARSRCSRGCAGVRRQAPYRRFRNALPSISPVRQTPSIAARSRHDQAWCSVTLRSGLRRFARFPDDPAQPFNQGPGVRHRPRAGAGRLPRSAGVPRRRRVRRAYRRSGPPPPEQASVRLPDGPRGPWRRGARR